MSSITNDLICEVLRDIQGLVGRMEAEFTDVKTRLTDLERSSGLVLTEIGRVREGFAGQTSRVDR